MNGPGFSTKTSIRVVVRPTSVGLGSFVLPGTASCTKNGAPLTWSPATPPRSQSTPAPSAVLYQPTAAAASETINMTERNGRSVSLVIVGSRDETVLLRRRPPEARRERERVGDSPVPGPWLIGRRRRPIRRPNRALTSSQSRTINGRGESIDRKSTRL